MIALFFEGVRGVHIPRDRGTLRYNKISTGQITCKIPDLSKFSTEFHLLVSNLILMTAENGELHKKEDDRKGLEM